MLPPLSKYSLCALLQMDTSDKHISKGGVTVAYALKLHNPALLTVDNTSIAMGTTELPVHLTNMYLFCGRNLERHRKLYRIRSVWWTCFRLLLTTTPFYNQMNQSHFRFWRPRVRSFSSMIRQCTSWSHWLSHYEAALISLWLSLSFLSCNLFFFFCRGVDVSRLRWVLSILLFTISSWVTVTPVSRSWYTIDKCASLCLHLFLLPVIGFSVGSLVPSDVPQELTVPLNLHLINVISTAYQTTTTCNAACPTSRHICFLPPPDVSAPDLDCRQRRYSDNVFHTKANTWA